MAGAGVGAAGRSRGLRRADAPAPAPMPAPATPAAATATAATASAASAAAAAAAAPSLGPAGTLRVVLANRTSPTGRGPAAPPTSGWGVDHPPHAPTWPLAQDGHPTPQMATPRPPQWQLFGLPLGMWP